LVPTMACTRRAVAFVATMAVINVLGAPSVLAGRGDSVLAAGTSPWQIHLALAGRGADGASSSMTVSWVTNGTTATSTVEYGLSPTALSQSATGTSNSYYAPTVSHHVVLPGPLKPATRYYYRCGDAAGGWSDVRSFSSAPTSDAAITVMVVGDQGLYNSNATVELMKQHVDAVDFLLHVGDIGYADDAFLHDPLKFGYEPTWNQYMSNLEPLVSANAMQVCPGNHESECHSPICVLSKTKKAAFANFSAYNHRFRMPIGPDESNSGTNMWSSYNYGMVHFVNIDTETDYPGAPLDDYFSKSGGFGRQLDWLEADLARAASERDVRPWIIVSGHRPIYTISGCNADGSLKGQHLKTAAAFEGLLRKYKVDLFLAGHVHAYERQYPVYNATRMGTYADPGATVHMVVGTGGDTEGHQSYDGKPRPSWHAEDNDTDFGFGVLKVTDAKTLSWQFLRASDGSVADSFTLTRSS